MFVRCLILSFFAVAFASRAETIVSQSQQFVVHSSGKRIAIDKIPAGTVEVVPEFLVVTAERVRQALVAEIPALAEARSPIHIAIIDTAGADSPVTIASSRFADGWKYEMAVPRVAEQSRLVKGFMNALLLQYANHGSERSAELPAWLTEGLAEQLYFSIGPSFVISRAPTAWESSTRDINHWTREMLRTNALPSFQELTMAAVPPDNTLQQSVYLAGAHLLAHALLQAPNGRQHFAKFLRSLPHTWNWQTAFMHSFEFHRMLDVEKWWSLTTIEFTTRDQRQAWSQEMSLRKLDELVRVRVEYRDATNALPEVRLVDVKAILEQNDAGLQQQALQEIVSQLKYTVPHMAQPVAAIALSYEKTLEGYLQNRGRKVVVRPGLPTTPAALSQSQKSDLLRRLAALDQQRRALADRTVTAAR
ncbi:MAG TPA: hypothetical protein VI282_18200 [Verrucomicrobiae bacterium]